MAMKNTSKTSFDIRLGGYIKGCTTLGPFTFFEAAFDGFKSFKLGEEFTLPIRTPAQSSSNTFVRANWNLKNEKKKLN